MFQLRRLACDGGLLSVLAITALAQSLAFEAASIKLSGPRSVRGSAGGPGSSDPGQYTFERATLFDLIAQAYDVNDFQISSTFPLDQQRFDLVVKIPVGATKEQFRAMMQTLLAERFHLKVHMVSKEFPALDLTVANGGPKLEEAAAGQPGISSRFSMEGGFEIAHVAARKASLARLAMMLSRPNDPPVLDRTGLTGTYDFTLDYSTERGATAGPSVPPSAPDLAVALRQQLGLQLVRKKEPFDVVVVDAVDKMPTAN
jgi:uncharacterized protein (TIGR03435 family)